jgi:quinol monooxygenase YgiN
MYGTIVRYQAKPGMADALLTLGRSLPPRHIPGFITQTVYRMTANPDEFYLILVFESKAAYEANAHDPAQQAVYSQWRALLVADPEWHDGEIILGI